MNCRPELDVLPVVASIPNRLTFTARLSCDRVRRQTLAAARFSTQLAVDFWQRLRLYESCAIPGNSHHRAISKGIICDKTLLSWIDRLCHADRAADVARCAWSGRWASPGPLSVRCIFDELGRHAGAGINIRQLLP